MTVLKIRNFIIAFALILAAFLFQYCVFGNIGALECAPNFVLVVVFIYGYSGGKISGMLVGFFAGLITDVFFCDVLGFNALLFFLIGFLAGVCNKYFYSNNMVLPLLILFGSNVCYCLIYYVVWFVFRSRFIFGYALIHIIIPECILTVCAGIILFIPLTKLNRRLLIKS